MELFRLWNTTRLGSLPKEVIYKVTTLAFDDLHYLIPPSTLWSIIFGHRGVCIPGRWREPDWPQEHTWEEQGKLNLENLELDDRMRAVLNNPTLNVVRGDARIISLMQQVLFTAAQVRWSEESMDKAMREYHLDYFAYHFPWYILTRAEAREVVQLVVALAPRLENAWEAVSLAYGEALAHARENHGSCGMDNYPGFGEFR